METKLFEDYIGKKVIVNLYSGAVLVGTLEHNNTRNYKEDPYMITTGGAYTYYLNESVVDSIREQSSKHREHKELVDG